MTTNSARGSEWRKWDLHVHAPGTKQSDGFKCAAGNPLDEYCRQLYESDVHAFGITDYYSADCYFQVRERYTTLYPKSRKLLIPNIELRLNESVNKRLEEVHFHLLFNPDYPDIDQRIDSFLRDLSLVKTDNDARSQRASELKSETDFAGATTTRKNIEDALTKTFGTIDHLDYVLLLCPANNDGIRPEPGKVRKEQISDEIHKFCDAFFGNSGNVSYFLRDDVPKESSEALKPKPVLSGCDAHSFEQLNQRLGKVYSEASGEFIHRPTWIKADLTYEGLKQIVFEPRNRVSISEMPEALCRLRDNPTDFIESLQISAVNAYNPTEYGIWFDEEVISFNPELVAIIGNKGSGKSALTDTLGLLGNSHNQHLRPDGANKAVEMFSFLNTEKFLKRGLANNFHARLGWHAGEPDEATLAARVEHHLPEKVQYLPQKYLERVCANIGVEEFRATLNDVVFRYVRDKDTHGKGNLDDLIKYRTEQSEADIDKKRQELHRANTKLVSLERRLTQNHAADLEQRVALKTAEVSEQLRLRPGRAARPSAGANADQNGASRIVELTAAIANMEEDIKQRRIEEREISDQVEQLRQMRVAIEREAGSVKQLEAQYAAILERAELSFAAIVKLETNFASLDTAIHTREQRLKELELLLASASELDGIAAKDPDQWNDEKLAAAKNESLVCKKGEMEQQRSQRIEALDQGERQFQENLQRRREWLSRMQDLFGDKEEPGPDTLRGLRREERRVVNEYPADRDAAALERSRLATEVFRSKRKLTEFYDDLKLSIDQEIAKCRDGLGEYEISIDAGLRFDEAGFVSALSGFINHSVVGTFRGREDGEARLRETARSVDRWEDETDVIGFVEQVAGALQQDLSKDPPQPSNPFDQLKGERGLDELYDYLFGFGYLAPKYDLRVDGKELSELSAGERGGVLLIFYLMLDKATTPLIIDQPEDNLDNKSVYEILVTFIKKAKKRRQIILATHNPNLAVVADAEQIIHVSIDKAEKQNDFCVVSGAIENPQINRTVVDILEGTMPAFDNRRLKYRRPSTA